jgi:DNA-binding transcriptional LysR family regulator
MKDFQNFDLNLLKVLDSLLREGSLSNAAKVLHVSQPTISASLGKLREVFHDELFVRTGTGMQPTPRALDLKEPIRRVLESVRGDVLGTGQFDPARETRSFTITTPDIGETLLLPRLIAALMREAPQVNVRSVVVGPQHIEDALEAGDIDLAVGYFPDLKRASTMQQVLFTHGFACLVRSDHPLIGDKLTTENFLAAHHVIVSSEGRSQELFEEELLKRGLERRCVLQIPHFMSVPFVVASTDLIVTVPRAVAVFFSGLANLQVLDPPFDAPDFPVKQFWHRRFQSDARNVWLRSMMASLYQSSSIPDGHLLPNP